MMRVVGTKKARETMAAIFHVKMTETSNATYDTAAVTKMMLYSVSQNFFIPV